MKWEMSYVHQDDKRGVRLVVEHNASRDSWYWTAYDGWEGEEGEPLAESKQMTHTAEEAMADAAEWLQTYGNSV